MRVAYNPPIVTNGLVLCLDAGNVKSYPGSGTTWNMYACSWDGGSINTYLNGVSINSGARTGSLNTSDTGGMEIGKDEELARYLSGNISSCLMYNRALTAAEIQQNFNATRSRFGI